MGFKSEISLKEAQDFHGHMGPYLVLGLKMGRLIVEKLGKERKGLTVEVHSGFVPPLSCVIDGIQLSTPCTVGNGGIVVKEGKQVLAIGRKGERVLTIKLKDQIKERIITILSSQNNKATEGEMEDLAFNLWNMPDSELFKLS